MLLYDKKDKQIVIEYAAVCEIPIKKIKKQYRLVGLVSYL